MSVCKATHDYDAKTDDELSFRLGDMLTIINVEGGWFMAELVSNPSRQGYIPSNHVVKVKAGLPAKILAATICKALHDYDAQDDDELSFRNGDLLTIINDTDDGWWKVELVSDPSRQSMIPSNYVVKVKAVRNARAIMASKTFKREMQPALDTIRSTPGLTPAEAKEVCDGAMLLEATLEAMREQCVQDFIVEGKCRRKMTPEEKARAGVGEWKLQESGTAGVNHQWTSPGSGIFAALKSLTAEAKTVARGSLTAITEAAVARAYAAAVDAVGGEAVVAGWSSGGDAMADLKPANLDAARQPVPSCYEGKDGNTYCNIASDWDAESQAMFAEVRERGKAGEYGPATEEANSDLYSLLNLDTSLESRSYSIYIITRAYFTRPHVAEWLSPLIAAVGGTLQIGPIKSIERANQKTADDYRGRPGNRKPENAYVKDRLRFSGLFKTLASLRETFLAIEAACTPRGGAAGGGGGGGNISGDGAAAPELVEVKNRLARATHDVVVVVRFEGMLCEIQLHPAPVHRLKGLMHIAYGILRLDDSKPPVPKAIVSIYPWRIEERVDADVKLEVSFRA